MKISLITIHVGFNFGSVLQCFATQKKLEELGYEVEVINYIPDRVTYRRQFRRMVRSNKEFFIGLARIPNYWINNQIYGNFLKNYIHLTQRKYYSLDDLKKKTPKADIYMTGSDQVWNSIHNEGFDTAYYFSFLPDNTVKVAYSSSFGRDSLPNEELVKIKKYLNDFRSVSVRENSAVKILNAIGINAIHTLDPTFLLNKKEWESMMSKRLITSNYLLLFTPYNTVSSEIILNAARKIARTKNLIIVSFSWTFINVKGVDKTIKYASPGDFLSLFNYADFIITNSFHGTAFSINLNKQFVVFSPSKFATRLISILEQVHLSNRLMTEPFDLDNESSKIQYDIVNSILDVERKRSIEYLKSIMKLVHVS